MCGISGSGKTHFVNENFSKEYIVSDDNYFMSSNGARGEFDPKFSREARNSCLIDFISNCHSGYLAVRGYNDGNCNPMWVAATPPMIVVDNFNCSIEDILPFYSIADAYGYHVEVITMLANVDVATNRSIRNQKVKDSNYLYHVLMWNMKFPEPMKTRVKRSYFTWNEVTNKLEPG